MFLRTKGNLDGRDPPDFSFTNLFLIESLGSFEPDAAVCPPKVPGLLKLKSEAVQPRREASSCLRFLEWAVTPPRDCSSDLLGPPPWRPQSRVASGSNSVPPQRTLRGLRDGPIVPAFFPPPLFCRPPAIFPGELLARRARVASGVVFKHS